MRKTSTLATAIAFAVTAHPGLAAEPASISFSHNDWELACDNTRTCRAAGYHAETGQNPPVTVLLERRAGPGTPIVAQLIFGDEEDAVARSGDLTMSVDGRAMGDIEFSPNGSGAVLSPAQTAALLRAVVGTGKVAWHEEGRTWTLSGKGASAVLLKMDEFQGRLGTPGAIIRKGSNAESAVLPAIPAPVVVAAKVPGTALPSLNKDDQRQLLATLRKTTDDEVCADLAAIPTGENEFSYAPLTKDKMLVSARCWRGAYNEGHGYWIANRKPPFSPVLVTELGTDYDQGTITGAHKGRGIGDCWGHNKWVWDGRRFVHTDSYTTGMCREITAGGAWTLPTLVSEVR